MTEYITKSDAVRVVALILAAEAQIDGYNVDVKDCVPEAEAWVKDYCRVVNIVNGEREGE